MMKFYFRSEKSTNVQTDVVVYDDGSSQSTEKKSVEVRLKKVSFLIFLILESLN